MVAFALFASQANVKAEELLDMISKEQVAVTGYSTGFDAYNCYTETQRQQFERQKGWTPIVDRLKANARFKAVVNQIAAMDSAARETLLRRAENSRRPTYAEANPPGPHRDGRSTTDAGAAVESQIARRIVESVRGMISPKP
jgi:hypothetical protein